MASWDLSVSTAPLSGARLDLRGEPGGAIGFDWSISATRRICCFSSPCRSSSSSGSRSYMTSTTSGRRCSRPSSADAACCTRLIRLAERLTYACADFVLATNESVRQVALERGKKSATRVFVVRTAPKIATLHYQPDPSLKKGRSYLVGYVGVMGECGRSGLPDGRRCSSDPRIGPQGHSVSADGYRAGELPVGAQRDRLVFEEYVDLPGRVTNEFLFAALQTMDVGVSCDPINSYNDHCTMNKVLEYMAFAKPQVLFDLKEGRASAGGAAVYVRENSAVKLADAIQELLDDPVARDKMGRLGQERILTQLNWERSAQQLVKAYESPCRAQCETDRAVPGRTAGTSGSARSYASSGRRAGAGYPFGHQRRDREDEGGAGENEPAPEGTSTARPGSQGPGDGQDAGLARRAREGEKPAGNAYPTGLQRGRDSSCRRLRKHPIPGWRPGRLRWS